MKDATYEEIEGDFLQILTDFIATMNEFASDVSQDVQNRKRALTVAENTEKILISLRRSERRRLRAALAPSPSEHPA